MSRRPAITPISLTPRQRDRHQSILQGIVSVSLMGSLAGTGWLAGALGSITEHQRQAAAQSKAPVVKAPTRKTVAKVTPRKKRRVVRYVYAAPVHRTTTRTYTPTYVAPRPAAQPVSRPKPAPRPPAPAPQPAPATTTTSGS